MRVGVSTRAHERVSGHRGTPGGRDPACRWLYVRASTCASVLACRRARFRIGLKARARCSVGHLASRGKPTPPAQQKPVRGVFLSGLPHPPPCPGHTLTITRNPSVCVGGKRSFTQCCFMCTNIFIKRNISLGQLKSLIAIM